jgi:UDP:flavonoid glycosyltransferase YjiC (YdhE family)
MARVLIVATAGAGGDLQPLIAAALALRARGHETPFLGDASVERALAPLGIDVDVLPAEFDLGPRLIAAIRDGMAASGGDPAAAGMAVQHALEHWAHETAEPVQRATTAHAPDAAVTSLFGVEVLHCASPTQPWAVVNSTFYVGTPMQRAIEQDFAARAIPLIGRYTGLLDSASLVLHASDQVFDFGFEGLPDGHHYVGPLGIWEPPMAAAALDEPGPPWVLVTISSQMQDDIPIAQAALEALADRPVRVLLTVGPDHDPAELSAVPSNARVERTASHVAVLERGVLMLSHAGHGSVMKALWHGCPMVLVPWGRDQPGVAARAAALGVAEIVDREAATTTTIGATIDQSLGNQAMRASAAQHSARLKATDPPAAAAALIEGLVESV